MGFLTQLPAFGRLLLPAFGRLLLPDEQVNATCMKLVSKRVDWGSGRTAMLWPAAALVCLGSAFAFIPLAPNFPIDTLDSGWAYAINVAMAKGLVLGRDVVFTFGPYASLYSTQFSPATDLPMLAGGTLLAAGFAAGLLCLARGGAMLASMGFALFLPLAWHDAQLFALPVVMLLLCFRTALPAGHPGHIAVDAQVKLALALLTASLALLPLIKGTLVIASGLALVLSCAALALGGSAMLAVAGVVIYAAAMPLFWVLSPQPLSALPGFFIAQLPIITGYTSAMTLDGPRWQAPLYIACCLAFALVHWRYLTAAGRAGGILLAGSALLLFLSFKEGFVRHDLHALTAAEMLAIAGWAGLLLGRNDFLPGVALAIGLSGWVLIEFPMAGAPSVTESYSEPALGLVTRLFHSQDLKSDYDDSLAAIRAISPLPALTGTTDIYSFGQSALLASQLDWDPRPVLQSYSAYTPALLRADAAHLAGPSAPDNILYAVQPLDAKLPALDDGASWPLLLTDYQFAGFAGHATTQFDGDGGIVAILTRRKDPDHFTLQPVLTGMTKLGAAVPLPASPGLIWAEVTLKPSLAGKLLTLLYKPPELMIAYNLADGQSIGYHYFAGGGESGFLIAPVVRDTQEFAGLISAPPGSVPRSAPYPLSFYIRPFGRYWNYWAWQHAYRLRLFTLQISPG